MIEASTPAEFSGLDPKQILVTALEKVTDPQAVRLVFRVLVNIAERDPDLERRLARFALSETTGWIRMDDMHRILGAVHRGLAEVAGASEDEVVWMRYLDVAGAWLSYPSDETVKALEKIVSHSSHLENRTNESKYIGQRAIEYLGRMGTDTAAEALVNLRRSSDPGLREAALDALGKASESRLAQWWPLLWTGDAQKGFPSASVSEKFTLIEFSDRLQPDKAEELLSQHGLKDPDQTVYEAAEWRLRLLREQSVR